LGAFLHSCNAGGKHRLVGEIGPSAGFVAAG
jgi:hypothetical protein